MRTPPDLYQDAELYDALHAGYRDDIAFYRNLALDNPGRVLEIGAGTGRITLELARLAEELVALEPADALHAPLRARLAQKSSELHAPATVVATTLESYARDRRDESFDLIVAPFHVVMHLFTLDQQDAFFHAARALVAEDGMLAFDVAAPPVGVLEGVPRRELASILPDGTNRAVTRIQSYDPTSQVLTSRFEVDEIDPDGRMKRRFVTLTQRTYGRFELERAVLTAGFQRVRTWGDFDRRPVEASSVRFVVTAQP